MFTASNLPRGGKNLCSIMGAVSLLHDIPRMHLVHMDGHRARENTFGTHRAGGNTRVERHVLRWLEEKDSPPAAPPQCVA